MKKNLILLFLGLTILLSLFSTGVVAADYDNLSPISAVKQVNEWVSDIFGNYNEIWYVVDGAFWFLVILCMFWGSAAILGGSVNQLKWFESRAGKFATLLMALAAAGAILMMQRDTGFRLLSASWIILGFLVTVVVGGIALILTRFTEKNKVTWWPPIFSLSLMVWYAGIRTLAEPWVEFIQKIPVVREIVVLALALAPVILVLFSLAGFIKLFRWSAIGVKKTGLKSEAELKQLEEVFDQAEAHEAMKTEQQALRNLRYLARKVDAAQHVIHEMETLSNEGRRERWEGEKGWFKKGKNHIKFSNLIGELRKAQVSVGAFNGMINVIIKKGLKLTDDEREELGIDTDELETLQASALREGDEISQIIATMNNTVRNVGDDPDDWDEVPGQIDHISRAYTKLLGDVNSLVIMYDNLFKEITKKAAREREAAAAGGAGAGGGAGGGP
ncbi:hypothetical protein ACFLZB_01110 [Nanoarchaeota archaeon]